MLDVPVRKNLNDMDTAYMDAAEMYPVTRAMIRTGGQPKVRDEVR